MPLCLSGCCNDLDCLTPSPASLLTWTLGYITLCQQHWSPYPLSWGWLETFWRQYYKQLLVHLWITACMPSSCALLVYWGHNAPEGLQEFVYKNVLLGFKTDKNYSFRISRTGHNLQTQSLGGLLLKWSAVEMALKQSRNIGHYHQRVARPILVHARFGLQTYQEWQPQVVP